MADRVVQSCRQALSRPDRLIRTVLVNGHKGSAGAYTGLCAMPNGSSILLLIDAVLKETQRQARGTEARRLIQHAIQRVAAISAAQGLLHDPDGATRINGWDLLTAICLTVPLPMQDSVEPRADELPEFKPVVEDTTAPIAEVSVVETPAPVA